MMPVFFKRDQRHLNIERSFIQELDQQQNRQASPIQLPPSVTHLDLRAPTAVLAMHMEVLQQACQVVAMEALVKVKARYTTHMQVRPTQVFQLQWVLT